MNVVALRKGRSERRTAAAPVRDKRERFRSLAEKRVDAAVDDLRKIGNLFSRNYEFDPEHADKIIIHLEQALADLKARRALSRPKPKFRL